MAAPIIWGIGIAATAVVGWLGVKSGRRIAEDIDTLGDVAVAGAAGWIAARITDSPAVGAGTGLVAFWALRQGQGTR